MKKKNFLTLGVFIAILLKDLNISDKDDIQAIYTRLTEKYGSNWSDIPVKNVMYYPILLLLDDILGTKGITPKKIATSIVKIIKEFDTEETLNELLFFLKA